jgi:ABC-type transporter Mla subunit MlaD
MSVEERVLKLEEIVGALAQLAQKTDRRLVQADDRLDKLTEIAVRFDERLDALVAAQTNSDERMAALADAQIRTEEALTLLAGAQARTEEQLKETNERLNNLIVVVERYITGT